MSPGGQGTGRSTRPSCGMGGGQRPCRQTALRTRSRSTCLRATRRGSAAVTKEASHELYRSVQKVSPRWGRRGGNGRLMLTSGANRPAGAAIPDSRLFMRAPGNRAGSLDRFLTYRAGQPGLIQLTGSSDGLAGGRCWRVAKCRPGTPDGAGHGTTRKSCCHCRPSASRRRSRGTRGQAA